MKHLPRLIAFVCVGAGGQVFAADPPAASPPAERTASSEPASTAAAAATTAAAEKAKDDALKTEMKTMKARGYKPEVHNGVTVYCRYETVIGSRFETKNCGSAFDIQKATEQSQEALSHAQRSNFNGSRGN